jgi:hypothetical protein
VADIRPSFLDIVGPISASTFLRNSKSSSCPSSWGTSCRSSRGSSTGTSTTTTHVGVAGSTTFQRFFDFRLASHVLHLLARASPFCAPRLTHTFEKVPSPSLYSYFLLLWQCPRLPCRSASFHRSFPHRRLISPNLPVDISLSFSLSLSLSLYVSVVCPSPES